VSPATARSRLRRRPSERPLAAAAAYAALDRSHNLLDRELRATARRRHAVEHHRILSPESALYRLELHLDEVEREERVVGRWVRRRYASVADRADGTALPN